MTAAAAVLGMTATAPAHAVDEPAGRQRSASGESSPNLAWFEGTTIDLSKGWGAAQACLIWRQGGVAECFRTGPELDARAAELVSSWQAATGASAAPGGTMEAEASSYSCSSSLDLYDYSWYGGRRGSFWDRGFWQNLADFGFDNRVSSYVTGACPTHLAEYAWGGGYWYPGYTGAWAAEPYMSAGWDNRVSSIYIG